MQLINIDGKDIEVKGFLWSIKDQDKDSGRNLAGIMERNLLDHSVNTLAITFPPQNQYERQQTLIMLHKEKLTCKFISPLTNQIETCIMMHGDLDSELYWNIQDSNGNDEILYSEFQVKLVEY